MIITVATMKGGSGKSTLASCLAVHWHLTGPASDLDRRRSATLHHAACRARARARRRQPSSRMRRKKPPRPRGVSPATTASVIIDTPGFRSKTTLDCLAAADFVLVPVKPSPFDVDRMLDTLSILTDRPDGRRPLFRCLLTQTTRDSVIARTSAPSSPRPACRCLHTEMQNRVAYPEATLWGATPSLISWKGPAARRSPRSPTNSMRCSAPQQAAA